MKKSLNFYLGASLLLFFIFLVYFLPRFLVASLGENHPWLSYIYSYTLGSCFLLFSSFVIFSVSEKHKEKRKQDRFWMTILTGMLLWGLLLHGVWIWFANIHPFKG